MSVNVQQSEESTQSSKLKNSTIRGTRLLMKVRDLRKSFGGQVVLNGISLDLHEGEVILLRGDNGSGKTTLLNILTGNLEPDSGSIWIDTNGSEENFKFPLHWWQKLNPFSHFTPERVASEAVGRTWQDVRLFKTRSLLENIAVATPGQPGENPIAVLMRNRLMRRFERNNQDKSKELLVKLGLVNRENSSADKVSLGQVKRVSIARAIRAGARILFLDEPLSGLDTDGIEDTLEFLKSLVERENVTLVIVEHIFNIPRILSLATTVWTLYNSQIQVDSSNSVSARIPFGFDSVIQKLIDQLAGPGHQIHEKILYGGARLLRITSLSASSNTEVPVLDVQSILVRRNSRLVVGRQLQDGSMDGISFSLYKGDVFILCAPNGWGKTTLLEALCGIIPTAQGQIFLSGMDIHRLPAWKRARLISDN